MIGYVVIDLVLY